MNKFEEYKNRFLDVLLNNFVPFWEKFSPDKIYGGFLCGFDRDGTPISYIKGSDWKGPFHNVRAFMLISQMLDSIIENKELNFNRWG